MGIPDEGSSFAAEEEPLEDQGVSGLEGAEEHLSGNPDGRSTTNSDPEPPAGQIEGEATTYVQSRVDTQGPPRPRRHPAFFSELEEPERNVRRHVNNVSEIHENEIIMDFDELEQNEIIENLLSHGNENSHEIISRMGDGTDFFSRMSRERWDSCATILVASFHCPCCLEEYTNYETKDLSPCHWNRKFCK